LFENIEGDPSKTLAMKVSVALIKKPRGFRGELAVVPYKANTESLRPGLRVTLQKGDRAQDFVIDEVEGFGGRIAVKLAGIESQEAALAWRDGELMVEMADLAHPGEDEYYHFQLEGSEVFEESGAFVGIVTAVDFFSANDVLVVKAENGEVLLPFIKSVIVSVDIRAKRITIRKIEGLY
jgi:16S rRNA processing protein RimM